MENGAQASVVERRMRRIADILRENKDLSGKITLGARHPTWSKEPDAAPHTGWVAVKMNNSRSTIFIDVKDEPRRKPTAYFGEPEAEKCAKEIAKAISKAQGWLVNMDVAGYGTGSCQRTKANYIKL